MGRRKTPTASGDIRKPKPATTPEARENQLISMAYDLAEQRMLDGTASAQEVTHFLKMGSAKNRLEAEKLRKENELLVAKTEAMQSAKNVEALYSNAIKAMRKYTGADDGEEDEEDEE